ncbi:Hint domain-containing protein [Anianabacter salinae]|uniref:Hint domain-containing protein n=1 Tax=Anianabacter salinae TaxID=2851023 RepID=UPI00225E6FE1|nr:Hint domain-containing protein [Anianabacter salinae]MBV0913857.1 Hint domain-containing protein [Anianabacter salinae]
MDVGWLVGCKESVMARKITVQELNSLLGVDADLGVLNAQTFVLNDFGAPEVGEVVDNDGFFEVGDGTTTFNGDPVTYIGTGTASFGINVGGGLLGGLLGPITDLVFDTLGDPVPVTVFEAGGRLLVQYPEGEPPTFLGLDGVLLRFNLAPVNAPIPCFVAGTLIRTPDGDLPIEEIEPGASVLDEAGAVRDVVWVGRRNVQLPETLTAVSRRHRPVRIAAGAFGEGKPYADLYVSQQHRIALEGGNLELHVGTEKALAAACHLVGDRVSMARDMKEVSYHHILCRQHVIVIANGLPCESMLLGPAIISDGSFDRTWREIADLFPELCTERGRKRGMRPALPILRRAEAMMYFR